jgi:hypothetical protein
MELQVSIVACVTTSGLKLVVVIYVIIHYNYLGVLVENVDGKESYVIQY